MPTFGNTSIGASEQHIGWWKKAASQFTAPEKGTITDITAYLSHNQNGANVTAVIYADSGSDTPDALLGYITRNDVPGDSTFRWCTFTGFSIPITNGTKYWLGINSDATYSVVKASTESCNNRIITGTDHLPPDDPFGSGTDSDSIKLSVYATYTTGGAAHTKTWDADALFKKLGIKVGDEKKGLVGTATNSYATQCSFQRKAFYASGRFWIFYANSSSDIVFRTSTDGLSWSDETFVRDGGNYGPNVSVFFDGTYVHYAANSTGSYPWESAIYYRRGTPDSNGTITWSASEQTVNTAYNKASNLHIGVDSNGYVWIGYREYTNGTQHAYVIRSGNNDGTWGTTPNGFPYQLSDDLRLTWAVSPVPLTNGKMAMVYTGHNSVSYVEPIHVRVWNGEGWENEATTTSTSFHSMFHSAVAEGDDVHIVFMKFVDSETPLEIIYVKYDYSTNSLGTETPLQSSIPYEDDGTDYCAPVITRDVARNHLYVFWGFYPELGHIYYRKWNGSSWEDRVDWLDESADGFIADHTWSSFYVSNDGFMGLLYQTKSSSPYNIKFACLPRAATVDALFKKLDIQETVDVDALLRKFDILETFGVDVDFLKQKIKSFAVDAYFGSVMFQTISRQVDALFKRFDIPESFAVDACFGALMTQTISKQIDVVLKKLDAAATFGLDAYFGAVAAETYAKSFGLSVIFAYRVRLPELWLDENGKLVLNVSKPYTWVGT